MSILSINNLIKCGDLYNNLNINYKDAKEFLMKFLYSSNYMYSEYSESDEYIKDLIDVIDEIIIKDISLIDIIYLVQSITRYEFMSEHDDYLKSFRYMYHPEAVDLLCKNNNYVTLDNFNYILYFKNEKYSLLLKQNSLIILF